MAHQQLLVVDDHELALQTLCATAESLGWNANPLDSSEAAVSVMTGPGAHAYDVVLLDWHMPVMDGLGVAQRIRSKSPDTPIILVMVSSSERESVLALPESAAVDGVITKPVTSSSLYDAVLSAKRNHGQLQPISERIPYTRLSGVRVLVVDDSVLNREVAVNVLESEGAVCEVACDGLAACTLLKARPLDFDVVLMDVQMPTMDGYTATRQIRETPALRDLPVVGLSAGAFQQQRDDALASGMTEFVAKPFDVDQLVAVILNVTRARQLPAAPLTTSQPVPVDVIDRERGLRNWGSVPVFHAQLWRFLELHGDDARAIQQALTERAYERCSAAAHKLAGAAEAVGLRRVGEVARALELSARGSGAQRELAQALLAELEQSREAITREAEPKSSQPESVAADRRAR
jgi:CheY-like chemotaxis protein